MRVICSLIILSVSLPKDNLDIIFKGRGGRGGRALFLWMLSIVVVVVTNIDVPKACPWDGCVKTVFASVVKV